MKKILTYIRTNYGVGIPQENSMKLLRIVFQYHECVSESLKTKENDGKVQRRAVMNVIFSSSIKFLQYTTYKEPTPCKPSADAFRSIFTRLNWCMCLRDLCSDHDLGIHSDATARFQFRHLAVPNHRYGSAQANVQHREQMLKVFQSGVLTMQLVR